jgi:chromosome segregation ATPase
MTSHETEGISSSLPNAKSIRERIVSFHQQLVDTQEQLEEKEKKMHQREAQIQTGLAQTKQLQTIKSQVANMKEDAMQLFLEKEETLRQRKREMKACVEKQHMSMVSEMNEKQKQLDSYRTYLSSKAQELEETKRVMQTEYDGVVKALQQKERILMEGVKKLEAEKHAYQRVWSRTQNAQAMGYLPNSNVPNSEHCNNMTPHDSSGRQRLPVAMQGFNEGFATNLAGQLKVSPPLAADHKVPSVPEKSICSLQSFAVAPGGTRANRKPKKTRRGHLMPQVMIDSSSESEGE